MRSRRLLAAASGNVIDTIRRKHGEDAFCAAACVPGGTASPLLRCCSMVLLTCCHATACYAEAAVMCCPLGPPPLFFLDFAADFLPECTLHCTNRKRHGAPGLFRPPPCWRARQEEQHLRLCATCLAAAPLAANRALVPWAVAGITAGRLGSSFVAPSSSGQVELVDCTVWNSSSSAACAFAACQLGLESICVASVVAHEGWRRLDEW